MTRNGIRGFSAGVLITCAVFAFFYYVVFNNGNQTAAKSVVRQTPLTDATVTQYLTDHHRKAIDVDVYNQWMASAGAAAKKTQAKPAASSKPQQNQPVSYNLQIKSGMTPSDISAQLVNAKILPANQKVSFDQYLHNSKLDQFVQLGTFKVSSNMSIQKIAQVITNH
ncbi:MULTISPECIES: hypothetical protein [unclassified Sporolactobacillus]|uniref:hypothetical protein n=1 Tax=unclassified Sporolactobacillus TaxID=2628533 RepID=UPI002368DA6B|nr:hypothetical protein [Sporolactobacillus sp. CQH2019]MDD9150768.1 hypothetical protein [Sporolactobacillus sp. CQH2019]